MHWTAFLAYRRFPANARVADDLPCVGCGYNLRSSRAGGVCPECARPVGDSLFVLSQPEIVGRCIKTIGATYFGVLAIAIPCLSLGAAWTGIVGMGVLALTAIIRAVEVMELHMRGEIRALPVIGTRLRMLIGFAIVDVVLTVTSCVMLWYSAKIGFNPTLDAAINAMLLAWCVVYMVTAIVAGWFGSAVAVMLAYFLSRWEFILHRIGLGITSLCIIIAIATGFSPGVGSRTHQVAVLIAAVMLCISMPLLALGLVHLGAGAEHEHEPWDDVLDTD
jgi:hypothetical protein